NAAVVELDALPDAVRAGAQDHDLPAIARWRLARRLIGRVEVRRRGRELPGARVDHVVRRADTERPAALAHVPLGLAAELREQPVAETHALHAQQGNAIDVGQRAIPLLGVVHLLRLREEPRVDEGELADLVDAHAGLERALDLEDALGCRTPKC